MAKNFYDLDYIIEINEKRLEEYTSAYQKVLERLTNIIIVYSGLTIFLLPIIQDITGNEINHWLMYISFLIFIFLFSLSIFFTVRLIIPIEIAYLESPKIYYEDYRLQYEQTNVETEVPNLLKASYITELESALSTNYTVFSKKSSFYYNALMYGLLSVVPYIICLGFHISKKEDKIEKVQIVNSEILSKLHKIDTMAKTSDSSVKNSSNNRDCQINPKAATGTTSKLPGINSSHVITSHPKLIKENSHVQLNPKK